MFDKIFHFLKEGGIFMVPIGICSVVAVTIMIERALALRRSKIIKERLVEAVDELHYGEKPLRIEALCAEGDNPLSRLIRSCLLNLPWSKYENTETLQTKARAEIRDMERGLVLLEIVVGIAPLLGLLGAVSGLITIFDNVGDNIASQSTYIARGIAEALNTTVAGLAVAIPTLVAHSIFVRRVDSYAVELETICSDFLGKLYSQPETVEAVSAPSNSRD
jgi:biopolymer transport protein ExbB